MNRTFLALEIFTLLGAIAIFISDDVTYSANEYWLAGYAGGIATCLILHDIWLIIIKKI